MITPIDVIDGKRFEEDHQYSVFTLDDIYQGQIVGQETVRGWFRDVEYLVMKNGKKYVRDRMWSKFVGDFDLTRIKMKKIKGYRDDGISLDLIDSSSEGST